MRGQRGPTTTQVLNIIQKVPETVIHLKKDEEYYNNDNSGGPQEGRRGGKADNPPNIPVRVLL